MEARQRQGQWAEQIGASEAVDEPTVQNETPEQVEQQAVQMETPEQVEEASEHIEEQPEQVDPEHIEESDQVAHPVNVRILLLINNTISIADALIPISPSTLQAAINNVAVQYGVPTGQAVIYVTRGSDVAGVRVSGGEVVVMREVSWVGGLDELGVVGRDEAVLVVVRVEDGPVRSQAAPSVAEAESHHSQAVPSVSSVHSQAAAPSAHSRLVSPAAVSVHSQRRAPSRTSHHSALPDAPVIHVPSGAVSRAPSVHEASRAVSRAPSVVNV